ncbi:hypothetical protein GCM10010172_34510 [Paractinoplanes ferrugineus]|uniref:Heme oxygenase-like protein n=1 Tax=Paractinoplanes ferrugineus TaxID=113564 RepID=A0A919J5Z5_9ACTN|nr:iron-containing redox enzyme family protein [Actinoplanes ferrugineus]GIE15476.1 hypothetical protein Afe05nite_73160 [Actinoplanes ferrugineus]
MHYVATSAGAVTDTPRPPGAGIDSAFRTIYARAADPEAAIPGGGLPAAIRAEVRGGAEGLDRTLDELIEDAAGWSAEAARRFQELDPPADDEGHRRLIRRVVLDGAPLGLAAGAWLQWLTSPGTADEPLFLRILRLYASDVGAGHPGAARGSAYLALLRQLRASENAVPTARLAGDARIGDTAFRLPAMLLLMSRRPAEFCPELIGADLCLRTVGLPPPLTLVRPHTPADWAAIDYSHARDGGAAPAAECRAVAEALAGESAPAATGVRAGFAWTLAALREQHETLLDQLRASFDPAYDMAELIRLRSREGSVYHHDFMVEGRPLAGWLAECRDDPRPFLEVLARSKLVRPGRPLSSPLVSGLVSERGPMFRIFSPDDLAVISRWIETLPAGDANAARTPIAGPHPTNPRRPGEVLARLDHDEPPGPEPASLREAYHLLMGRTLGPRLRDWSLRYTQGWLARSRHRLDASAMPLPRQWGAEGLRPWLQVQHDRHSGDFESTAGTPLPARTAVIDDAVQTALLTLIDGSWLQGFTDYELAASEIGHSLFDTYWDELGNGEPVLNHPLIYRAVLKEMDVDLPPTASREFAQWPGFRAESFELPVYWLCVGRFPRTFLPEVLGLNLAMELSGVGGAYRRAGQALREYGFSTRFVDIHNTIDNVATGHSAWAADAIDTLMAGLPDSSGPGSRTEAWERVRTGFRSLNPPGGLLARRAERRARRGRTRWQPAGPAAAPTREDAGV